MKKLLALTLSLVLILAAVPMAIVANAADGDYSVNSATGNDSEDDTVYATLQEAVDASISAGVKKVVLEENVTITKTVTVKCSGGFTLDMNGHSLTYSPANEDVELEDGSTVNYYNEPAVFFDSTDTSGSPAPFTLDTQTTTEDAGTPRTDTDGTFVNNSGYAYFFKSDALNDARRKKTHFAMNYGSTRNYYGDITIEGAFIGQSNGTSNIYGDLTVTSYLTNSSGTTVVYGNVTCGKFNQGTYGAVKVYGYLRSTNAQDPYSLSVAKNALRSNTTTYTTYNSAATDTYNGYHIYLEGDTTVNCSSSSNVTLSFNGLYVDGNFEINLTGQSTSQERSITVSGDVNVTGSLTGTIKNTGKARYFIAKFNNSVKVGGEFSLALSAYTKLNLATGIDAGGKNLTDGEVVYSATEPIFVQDIECTVTTTDLTETSLLRVANTMLTGASIRLNDKNGVRFYTNVDKEAIAALQADGYTVELGTIIAPSDKIDGDFTHEDDNIDIKYQAVNEDGSFMYHEDNSGFSGVVGSIVDIKSSNIGRKFVGRGYVRVTKDGQSLITYARYVYGDANQNTRALKTVAASIMADTETFNALSEEKQALITEWAAAEDYVA